MPDTKLFFDAIRSGDLARVGALLEADPSLAGARNESGASPLLMSIYTGQKEVRDLLLSRCIEMDLAEACAAGDLSRVKRFVEANPTSANSFSTDGFPIFALACFFGHLDIARYLAEKGANIHAAATNGTGYNALTAAANGHLEIVKLLLGAGADPASTTDDGKSALVIATERNHPHIADFLRSRAASAC